MKPLVESSQSKKSQKCLKTMFNGLHIDKWDMHKKANLKESIESHIMFGGKSIKK
jgi:hypothetical protein